MSFAREREAAARQAREELPSGLRKAFEVYADATALSDTGRLRAQLSEAGFFDSSRASGQRAVLSGPASFRYFRVAGIILLVGLLAQAWLGSPARREIFAMVKKMDGALVLERGGRSFATTQLARIQEGDRLQAGKAGCRLRLSKGRSVALPPNARLRCGPANGQDVLGLEVLAGSVELTAKKAALRLLADGQPYELTGRCRLVQQSCCLGGRKDAVRLLLYQGGRISCCAAARHKKAGEQGADICCRKDAAKPLSGWLKCCPACRK